MNRVIKFRGLRTDGEGWVHGYYLRAIDDKTKDVRCIIFPVETSVHENPVEVIPETVCQFTGLTDKNGKEIYEGDIISSDGYPYIDEGNPNYNAVVEWIFAGFQYVLKCVNPTKRGISDGINEVLEDGEWCEVIGNIHEETEVQNG